MSDDKLALEVRRIYDEIKSRYSREKLESFAAAIFILADDLGTWYKENLGYDPRDIMAHKRMDKHEQPGRN